MACPYGWPYNSDDAMNVIGHDYKFAQFHHWEMFGDLLPKCACLFPDFICMKYSLINLAKKAFHFFCTNSYEIPAFSAVISILFSDDFAGFHLQDIELK